MSDQNAFNEAVKLLRLGHKSTLEIVSDIEDMLGLDKPAWQIVAEARTYLTELQTQALDASVSAFERGESHFEVSKKLTTLGFSPWDSDVIAWRAKRKVDAEMAQETKPE